MIKEFEFYHGVVFSKLIHECKNDISIKLFPTPSNASYILNNQIGIYIKHSAKRLSPWHFSVQRMHMLELLSMKEKFQEVFLILVCGEDGLVTLNFTEVKSLLNGNGETGWISAARSHRKEYSIKGSSGRLDHKIGKSDFIKKILKLG